MKIIFTGQTIIKEPYREYRYRLAYYEEEVQKIINKFLKEFPLYSDMQIRYEPANLIIKEKLS